MIENNHCFLSSQLWVGTLGWAQQGGFLLVSPGVICKAAVSRQPAWGRGSISAPCGPTFQLAGPSFLLWRLEGVLEAARALEAQAQESVV